MITQTIALTTSQTSQEDPFSEGSNWTYELTKNSNTKGTGKYKGTSTTLEISKGSVNVTNSNSTVLIIEDHRKRIEKLEFEMKELREALALK